MSLLHVELQDSADPPHKARVTIYYPKYTEGAVWTLLTPGAFASIPTGDNLPVSEVQSHEDGHNRLTGYVRWDSGEVASIFTLYQWNNWQAITSQVNPGKGKIYSNIGGLMASGPLTWKVYSPD